MEHQGDVTPPGPPLCQQGVLQEFESILWPILEVAVAEVDLDSVPPNSGSLLEMANALPAIERAVKPIIVR